MNGGLRLRLGGFALKYFKEIITDNENTIAEYNATQNNSQKVVDTQAKLWSTCQFFLFQFPFPLFSFKNKKMMQKGEKLLKEFFDQILLMYALNTK